MKIAIWTDNDLDGAGSALLLNHIYKKSADTLFIKETNDYDLIGYFKGWVSQYYDDYDRIFITDLYLPDELLEFVDREKIVIIDHHETHVNEKHKYKKATTCIQVHTSCVKLIREKFSKKLQNLPAELERLIDIVDDYDCYQLKYKESLKLNAVYHSLNKPRVDKFIERFSDGFKDFNAQEQNAIKLYFNKLKDQFDKTVYFSGSLKGYKVISCCADFGINEIAHSALKRFNADIVFVVIPNTKSVSIRKNKNTCDISLAKLAELLCDGGGHAYAAGGKITDKFLNFTKTLTHVH